METFIDLINNYGISAFIVAAIAFFVYEVIKAKIERKKKIQEAEAKLKEEELKAKSEEKEREHYANLLNSQLDLVKDMIEDLKAQQTHTVDEQEEDVRINTFLFNKLDTLIDCGCDRAYYIKMHNGGRDILGRGFLKMSIAAEKVDSDTPTIMSRFQNIPRTLIVDLYNAINTNDAYDVADSNALRESDTLTYQFLKEHGARTAAFRSIKTEDGLLIGILAIEFNNFELGQSKFAEATSKLTKAANEINGAIGSQGAEHFV